MRRTLVSLISLLLGTTAGLHSQETTDGATLQGIVRDSSTGLPIGYALIILVEKEQHVFAGESGRFVLTGLRGSSITLRVQQIGYRPRRIEVSLRARAGSGTPLVVELARQPVILPEIVVQGDVCTGVEAMAGDSTSGSILDEAFKNAERILAIERSYPFRVSFQRVTAVLDSNREPVGGWVDTVTYDSRGLTGYRKGRVLPLNPPRGRLENATYFTTSDLARPEFRKAHCFWYAGQDSSVDGFPSYRIGFAPRAGIKSVDWAGSFLIDTLTMRLLRSEARMVNLPPRGTSFKSGNCTVFYNPIAPTLVQEFQAACVHTHSTRPPKMVVERWLLLGSKFLGKTPVDPAPP